MSLRQIFGKVTVTENDDGTFEIDPAFIEELNETLRKRLVENNDVRPGTLRPSRLAHRILEDVEIQTTETRIGHGMGQAPPWYHVVMTSATVLATSVYETRRPDETFLYLIADVVVTVKIKVEA